ncbi:RNA-directed DNA polymerase from mobile element jockey [Nymphon striatum]|nr:RNA-directed DNA polymerase from mobile element jockey [Nymphon striatum]
MVLEKKHSTELAALELVDKLLTQMDKKCTPLTLFLDLSKAFDTIDYDILLNKLHYYGITGNSNKLIESYIRNRKQYVDIEGMESPQKTITRGVPQGSILGPLLFIIYMNDIARSTDFFDFLLYADDTTLSINIESILSKKNYSENETKVNALINMELENIDNWLKCNKLSLNVAKKMFSGHLIIIVSITGTVRNLFLLFMETSSPMFIPILMRHRQKSVQSRVRLLESTHGHQDLEHQVSLPGRVNECLLDSWPSKDGVIRSRELMDCSEDELLEELSYQGVIASYAKVTATNTKKEASTQTEHAWTTTKKTCSSSQTDSCQVLRTETNKNNNLPKNNDMQKISNHKLKTKNQLEKKKESVIPNPCLNISVKNKIKTYERVLKPPTLTQLKNSTEPIDFPSLDVIRSAAEAWESSDNDEVVICTESPKGKKKRQTA